MRLADNALNCVTFIAGKNPRTGKFQFIATGFFVKYIDAQGCGDSYLITAKHAAEQIEGSPFQIRIGDQPITMENVRWYYHKDRSVDVAVTPYMPFPVGDVVRFPGKHFLTEPKIKTKRIGPGDQAYAVGLYRLHPGKTKNRVVVHTGHIAMMPDPVERFSIKNWPHPIEGYAVEAQTLDGLSGSPVFVRRSIKVAPLENVGPPLAYGAVFLLGLWVAAWSGIPDDELRKDIEKKERKAKQQAGAIRVPAGMGVVAPAYHIRDVLELPKLQKMRRDKHEAEQVPREA